MSGIASKRVHEDGAASFTDSKRLRTSADHGKGSDNAQAPEGETSSCLFKRLKRQCLPPQILALPHVTKLIETLLLTPDEAITEAARTGQADWALELLSYHYCDISTAIHHAVHRCDAVMVKILLDVFIDEMEPESKQKAVHALNEGVGAAAGLGYVHIVELLAGEIMYSRRGFRTIRDALDEAAAKGQLQVVKFLIDHAEQIGYIDRYRMYPEVDTLTHAIRGGNMAVVDLLLMHPRLRWNLEGAFDAAMKRDDKGLAERIYQMYPVQFRGKNLFPQLAASGNLEAVKYLYCNGHDDIKSVARHSNKQLAGTFDKAFKNACAQCGTMDIAMLLYKTKRASQQGINKAFSTVRTPLLMKVLNDNENLSDEALVTAFEKAIHRHEKDTLEILEFISKEKCIPPELICKALEKAVQTRATGLVECLCNDPRVTPVAVTEAFVMAATSGYADLVSIIYSKQQISPETLLRAFTEAVHRGNLDATKQIMAFMTVEADVPREFKSKAFVIAARHGQMPVMKLVCESESGEWPLQVLKQALDAAEGNNCKMVKWIRKIICDQELKRLPK